MYLDREWRIPQPGDSPISWPGSDEEVARWSPWCCGWHVSFSDRCFTDPMGLLVTYGNDWIPLNMHPVIWQDTQSTATGDLRAIGVATLLNIIKL